MPITFLPVYSSSTEKPGSIAAMKNAEFVTSFNET